MSPEFSSKMGGVDFVDNVATQAVDMVDAQETELKLDLNRQTFLPVSVTYRVQDPKTGDWDDFADVYSDYQRHRRNHDPYAHCKIFE